MAEKVTTMLIKVDLQCPCCYKKIKKILCKFPDIRNQIYDEKQNTVTITVVSSCPERIRDKLYCKGGKTITCIEIKPPPGPVELNNTKKPGEKPIETEKTKPDGKADKPIVVQKPPIEDPTAEKPSERAPCPVSRYPTCFPPIGSGCEPCCNGYRYCGGLCHQPYGRPVPYPYGHWKTTGRYTTSYEYCTEEYSSCPIM